MGCRVDREGNLIFSFEIKIKSKYDSGGGFEPPSLDNPNTDSEPIPAPDNITAESGSPEQDTSAKQS